MANARSDRQIEVTNYTRTVWFFNLSHEVAERARKAGVPNIGELSDHFILGDKERKWSGDPVPNPIIPQWLWDDALAYNGPESLYVEEEGKKSRYGTPQKRQAAYIKGLSDNGSIRARSAA